MMPHDVLHPPSRLLSLQVVVRKGSTLKGSAVAKDKEGHIGATFSGNAAGDMLDPFFTVPEAYKKAMQPAVEKGYHIAFAKSGWSNGEVWAQFARFFVAAVAARGHKGVLLIVDGATFHRNPAAVKIFRDGGVRLLMLPPGTTHVTQPLDVGYFGPLKRAVKTDVKKQHYNVAMADWPETIVRSMRRVELDEASNKYKYLARAFKKTGLWPVDEKAFSNEHFALSDAATGLTDDDPRVAAARAITPEAAGIVVAHELAMKRKDLDDRLAKVVHAPRPMGNTSLPCDDSNLEVALPRWEKKLGIGEKRPRGRPRKVAAVAASAAAAGAGAAAAADSPAVPAARRGGRPRRSAAAGSESSDDDSSSEEEDDDNPYARVYASGRGSGKRRRSGE